MRQILAHSRNLARRLILSCLLAASVTIPAIASAKPMILATIAQLGEPMSRILGDCATVETLLGPGVDPHLYRLTRSDVAKALQADGLMANGLNLEAQMRDMFDRLSARLNDVIEPEKEPCIFKCSVISFCRSIDIGTLRLLPDLVPENLI